MLLSLLRHSYFYREQNFDEPFRDPLYSPKEKMV